MLTYRSSDMPETLRSPSQADGKGRGSRGAETSLTRIGCRRRRVRQMRQKRTAIIMISFGLLLGFIEICIVFSNL